MVIRKCKIWPETELLRHRLNACVGPMIFTFMPEHGLNVATVRAVSSAVRHMPTVHLTVLLIKRHQRALVERHGLVGEQN